MAGCGGDCSADGGCGDAAPAAPCAGCAESAFEDCGGCGTAEASRWEDSLDTSGHLLGEPDQANRELDHLDTSGHIAGRVHSVTAANVVDVSGHVRGRSSTGLVHAAAQYRSSPPSTPDAFQRPARQWEDSIDTSTLMNHSGSWHQTVPEASVSPDGRGDSACRPGLAWPGGPYNADGTASGFNPSGQAERVPAFIDEIWPPDPSVQSSNAWLASLVSREDAISLTRALRSRFRRPRIRFLVDNELSIAPWALNCLGRLCKYEVALTNRELEGVPGHYPSIVRNWLDAGGIAREIVELLQTEVAEISCSAGIGCQTDREDDVTSCWFVYGRIYEDVAVTLPYQQWHVEWIHAMYCCCEDDVLQEGTGGPTTGPGDQDGG